MEKKATSDVHTGESIARMLRVLSSSFRSLSLSLARAFARIYNGETDTSIRCWGKTDTCGEEIRQSQYHRIHKNNMGKKQLSGAAKRKKKKEKEEAIEEAAAEIERLKLGPSKLWTGLVTHHRDIFVSHVLSKLTATDRGFFANANTESLELLEYAGFNVQKLGCSIYECASISTLEYMWDHCPWGNRDAGGEVYDQTNFCAGIAQTKKLELMKWLREVKHCEWDNKAIEHAIANGDLEMVKYCYSNGCPYDVEELRHRGARFGHLECLRFLFDNVIPPSRLQYMERKVATDAAEFGHIDILKYLVEERKITEEVKHACAGSAVCNGNFECVKYLVEEARSPLHWIYIASARHMKQTKLLNYLREKGFPEPSNEQSARFLEVHREESEKYDFLRNSDRPPREDKIQNR